MLFRSAEFKNIYLKGAQSHAERLIDLNFKTILKEIPDGNKYRVTGNGRIVRKDDTSPTAAPTAWGQRAATQDNASRG